MAAMQEKKTNLIQKYEENQFQRDFIGVQQKILESFMKRAYEDIAKNELRVMAESSLLLESIPKSKIHKTIESTEDCTSIWACKSENDWPTRPNSPNSRNFRRNSPNGHTLPIDFSFAIELKDVEENCNPSTFASLCNLVKEFKKIKLSNQQNQANSKRLIRRVQALQKDQQNLAILQKISQETEKKLKKLETQNTELKKKNKDFINSVNKQKQKQPIEKVNTIKVLQLNQYLRQKEQSIKYKMNKIASIEQEVLKTIQGQVIIDGCSKCCNFIKKIKESILKLRKTLLEESEHIQSIYNRYKEALCAGTN